MGTSFATPLRLAEEAAEHGPGVWPLYLIAGALVILGITMIIFHRTFARWKYRFDVKDPDRAEPSGLNLAGTVLGGLFMIGCALWLLWEVSEL
jgi:hypothetical protein